MVLSDEAAEKALLIQLSDRGIISYETIQERFGEIPEIEKLRNKRERNARGNNTMNDQAGPFHSAEKDHDLAKIALQRGIVAPSEVGLELDERKEGERSPQEDMREMQTQRFSEKKEGAKKGEPQQGRPKNSKDSEKRQDKTVKPRVSADLHEMSSKSMWAKSAQKIISELVSPAMLEHFGKKNLRSLSATQTEQLEVFKFTILCGVEPYSKVTPEIIYALIQSKTNVPSEYYSLYSELSGDFIAKNGSNPSMDELRDIQAFVYSTLKN
jgi:hypothetical protein